MRVCVCTQVPVDVCKYMYVFIYIYTCIHIYPTCIHYMFGVYTTLDVMYREREYTYTKHGVCMSFMNHVQLRTSRCNTYTMFSVSMFYVYMHTLNMHTLNIVYVCRLSIMHTSRCNTYTMFSVCMFYVDIHTLNIHTLNIVFVCRLSIMCSCKRRDVIHTLNISVPLTAKQPRT